MILYIRRTGDDRTASCTELSEMVQGVEILQTPWEKMSLDTRRIFYETWVYYINP